LNKFPIAVLLFAAPIFAFGAPAVGGMRCDMTAQSFFEPLMQDGVIDLKPVRIERYVSYFGLTAAKSKHRFSKKWMQENTPTAFGIPVEAVFGYVGGQLAFAQDPERQTADVYGVIVSDGIANVQAQLRSVGADRAQTLRVDSNKTIIICKGV
jgi:hypothetical protein